MSFDIFPNKICQNRPTINLSLGSCDRQPRYIYYTDNMRNLIHLVFRKDTRIKSKQRKFDLKPKIWDENSKNCYFTDFYLRCHAIDIITYI